MFTHEAVVLRRAGRALGRALADMINTLNPGQLVLRLPTGPGEPAPQTSGAEYLEAVEREIDGAYSTGPADARREASSPDRAELRRRAAVAHDGAVAAATTVFNAFIEHARGRDGCPADRAAGAQAGSPKRTIETKLKLRSA